MLEDFWERFFASPSRRDWARTHYYLRDPHADFSKAVVLTLHEDAGPCSKTLSTNIISWSGFNGTGPEKQTKYMVCSSIKSSGQPISNVWDVLLADFEALAEGVDVNGERWRFVLVFGKADEENRVQSWGLASWSAEDEVCGECLADRSAKSYTDMRPEARWRPTERMSLEMYRGRLRTPLHPLARSRF